MNWTLKTKENNKAVFSIEIDEKEFEEATQEVYLRSRNRFNIPGFRKGKAPRKVIEMNYGEGIFYDEALNNLLPEAYDKAIEELELEPVAMPELDVEKLEKGEPIVVNIEVAIKPEVKLGDYKNIELEKVEHNVTDEDVEMELETIQEMNGRIVDVGDREAKEGDILTINFEGYIEDEKFEGGSAEGQEITLGENQFIPGFEEQLIGKKKEDKVEVEVTFPEDYFEESLKGKDAIFKVEIKEIKEKELPKLDDEFAIDVSEFDTLDEYKESLREKLEARAKENEKVEKENNVIDHIVEKTEIEIPEVMLDNQIENEISQFEQTLGMQALTLEKYYEMTNTSAEDLKQQVSPVAEQRLRADLILEAIEKEEEIEITEEEIEAELEKMAKEFQHENVEEFKDEMLGGSVERIKMSIGRDKTIELLISNTKWI